MSIEEYIEAHIEPEHPYLHALWRATHLHLNYPRMASGHLQGQVLRMLVQMIRPRLVLEIGTYTGYSALAMASALEPGAMLHTIECFDEQEDFTRPWIEGSPWADRVRFHIGDALSYLSPTLAATATSALAAPALDGLVSAAPVPAATAVPALAATVPDAFPSGSLQSPFPSDSLFDLVFIDADKRQYPDYYRAVLPRVRPGGYIIADNTLWDEHVLETLDTEHLDAKRSQTYGVQQFNDLVAADTSVEKVILPLRDGLTIIRKH